MSRGHRLPCRALGEHLDEVEPAQVGERRGGPAGRRCPASSTRVTVPIGSPAGTARSVALRGRAGGDDASPALDASPARELQHRSVGLARPRAARRPPTPVSLTSARETPLVWSVIERARRASPATRRRPCRRSPCRPSMTGWSARTPSRSPCRSDRRVPERRRAADDARGDRAVVGDAGAAVEAEQAAQLRVLAGRGLASAIACARSASRSWRELLDVALGVERVADPAERGRGPASARGWRPPGSARRPPGSRAGRSAGRRRRTRRSRR